MSSRQSLPRTSCEDAAREAVLCSQEGDEHPWGERGLGGTQPPDGSQVEGLVVGGSRGQMGPMIQTPKAARGPK